MINISGLYIYPVKSLAGIKLDNSKLSQFGLQYDRRWMIVDSSGKFMSQRMTPKMAVIKTQINDGKLTLSYQNKQIEVPQVDANSKQIQATVWGDSLNSYLVSDKVDEWLSLVLKQSCHLVYMPDRAKRQIDLDFAQEEHYVSFADAFPLLLVSQASISDLNSKLESPVNINRFRPNIVVNGVDAFAEDGWKNFTINSTYYKVAKPCSRCIMPSISQESGKQDNVKLLAVLNKYRKFNKKIKFGINILFINPKEVDNEVISIGDAIILE